MKHIDFLEMLIGPLANSGDGGGGITPSGSISITENGTYNVTQKASAIVAVPPYGEGSVNIGTNGSHDVSGKATAVVSVQPDLQSKSVTIQQNGTTNVTPDQGKDGLSGVEITVNVSGGGGGDVNDYAYDYLQAGFTGVLQDGSDPNATKLTHINQYGLYGASGLTGIDLQYCQQIDNYAFYNCPNVTKINLPACTKIGQYTLELAIHLVNEINLPSLESIGSYSLSGSGTGSENAIVKLISLPALKSQSGGFQRWTELRAVRLGSSVTSFVNGAFRYCSKLRTLLFGSSLAAVPTMGSSNDFGNTLLNSTGGKILVPSALVANFKAATRWSTYASHIFAIEDIPAWAAGSYSQGDVVKHNGHYYVSIVSSASQEPSASATDWLDLGAI